MNTAFSHALRVLICSSCGAAQHVSVEGGKMVCGVCQTQTELEPRRDSDGAPGSQLGAQERLARLGAQTGRDLFLPSELSHLTSDGISLVDGTAEQAMSEWQAQRQTLEIPEAEERFCHLTMLLFDHLRQQQDDLQLRAILETALEVAPSARFRQVFRCALAREAARGDDLTAAGDWLLPCDTASAEISAHSAHVYSVAYVATHARHFSEVLDVLGKSADEVPVSAALDPICAILRANALERLGSVDDAAKELCAGMKRVKGGVPTIERTLRTTTELLLCRGCFVRARLLVGDVDDRPSRRADTLGRRQRRRILAAAPWVVLSAVFLALAVATDPADATSGGHRLDVFFLVMGASFSVPLFVMAAKSRNKRRR